jgi:hypothetical protein
MKIELMLSESESETLLNLSINHGWRDVRVRGAGLLRLGAGRTLMLSRTSGVSAINRSTPGGTPGRSGEWLG